MNVHFTTALLALSLFFLSAEGLECYNCTSYYDDTCADEYSPRNNHLITCPEQDPEDPESLPPACFKIKSFVDNTWRYLRECHEKHAGQAAECTNEDDADGNVITSCYCFGEKCNGASSLGFEAVLFSIPALVGITIRRAF